MRMACQPGDVSQGSGIADAFESARRKRAHREQAQCAPNGKFCRCIYTRLTITAQAHGTQGRTWGPIRFRLGSIAMRIYGPNGTALANAPAPARRAASGNFTVSEEEAPRNSTAASSLRSISTL